MKVYKQVLRLCGVLVLLGSASQGLYACDFSAPSSTTPTASTSQVYVSSTEISSKNTVVAPTSELPQQEHLYPTPQVSFDIFKKYPGAQYLVEQPTSSNYPLSFHFETDDNAESVEAFYKELALQQGWQEATPLEGREGTPRFYYGDYGKEHVYGYYFSFFATDGGSKLKTYVRVWINTSLPIYLGATDVVTKQWVGIDTGGDTVEFSTHDGPDAVIAFYKDILPETDWKLVEADSSNTQLFWQIGRSSHAKVTTERQASGLTHVVIEVYFGCCG
jgi:hypothetical protein